MAIVNAQRDAVESLLSMDTTKRGRIDPAVFGRAKQYRLQRGTKARSVALYIDSIRVARPQDRFPSAVVFTTEKTGPSTTYHSGLEDVRAAILVDYSGETPTYTQLRFAGNGGGNIRFAQMRNTVSFRPTI